MVDEMVRNIARKARSRYEIAFKLYAANIEFEDHSREFGSLNIRIPVEDGYMKIYDSMGEIRVQKFSNVVVA